MSIANSNILAAVLCSCLSTNIAWGAAFMDGVEKRLQDLEAKLGKLADQFLYGTAAPESVAGGLANIRDMSKYSYTTVSLCISFIVWVAAFLTELRDNELLSAMSLGSRKKLPTDQDGRSLEVRKILCMSVDLVCT